MPDVVRPLVADRADAYFAILGALLEARREGEEAPTLDELRRRVPVPDDDEAAFLRDLLQLEAWGCLTRALEPTRVRGYSDARRDRFRHRLTEDAAAFVSWLEARARDRARVSVPDAHERLADAIARVRELTALAPQLGSGGGEAGAGRASHLVRAVDGELDAIELSLARLDAELRVFGERDFDAARLERIVAGLETFLREHVGAVEQRTAAFGEAIDALEASGFAGSFAGVPGSLGDARALTTEADRGAGGEVLARWRGRVAAGGTLDRLARRVESSTRRTIATLREHVRASVEASRATPGSFDRALRVLASSGVASVHLGLWGHRPPVWAPGPGDVLAPPLPRRKTRAAPSEPAALPSPARPAPRPHAFSPEARLHAARAWLGRIGVLPDGAAVVSALDAADRSGPEAARAWMTIAHARHLGRGRGLSRLGLRAAARPGVVTFGDDVTGLVGPDVELRSAAGGLR